MKRLALVLTLALMGLFSSVAAQTQRTRFLGPPVPQPNPINERQRLQQRRIIQGARSGELTGAEVARLQREQRNIRQLERRVRSDGTVTTGERVRVQRQLQQSSRHIRRATNNNRDRN